MATRLKMKDLEAATGVGREAIRFYIAEGLLPEPERPKRNVAYYGEAHVRRIRAIRRLQEERFLPLAVIRSVLDSEDGGELASERFVAGLENLLPALVDGTRPGPPRPLEEVAESAGVSPAEVRELARRGIVSLSEAQTLEFRDAAIVELWGGLRRSGYAETDGYDPGFVVRYKELADRLAEEEVSHFLETYSGRLPADEAAELGARGLAIANQLLALLHVQAVMRVLREHLGREDAAPASAGAGPTEAARPAQSR